MKKNRFRYESSRDTVKAWLNKTTTNNEHIVQSLGQADLVIGSSVVSEVMH